MTRDELIEKVAPSLFTALFCAACVAIALFAARPAPARQCADGSTHCLQQIRALKSGDGDE